MLPVLGKEGAVQKREEIPLLKLFADLDPQGQAEPVIPVRWCLSAELVKIIRERGFAKPHVMIIVRQYHVRSGDYFYSGYKDEQIHVVPLEREMEFITIRSSGTKQIVACVVDIAHPDDVDNIRRIRDKIRDKYEIDNRSVFNVDGSIPCDHNNSPGARDWVYGLRYIDTKAILTVEIPAEGFAKEPHPANLWMVKNFHKNKGRDQCQFKRRLIYSYAYAIPTLIFLWPLRIIGLLFALWIGRRDINWRALLPLEMALPVSLTDSSNRWFSKKVGSYCHEPRPFTWRVINPLFLVAIPMWVHTVLAWPIHYEGSERTHPMVDGSLWHAALYSWAGLLTIVGIYWLGVGILMLIAILTSTTIGDALQKRRQLRKQRQEEAERQRVEERFQAYAAMTCANEAVNADVYALPRDKRTIRLRILDYKKGHCRPFAEKS